MIPLLQNPELELAEIFRVRKVIIFFSLNKVKEDLERKRKSRNFLSRAESLIETHNRKELVFTVGIQVPESRKVHLKMTISTQVLKHM